MIENIVPSIDEFVIGVVLTTEAPFANFLGDDCLPVRLDEEITMLIIFDEVLRIADTLQKLSHHSFSQIGVWLFVVHTHP